MSYQFSNSRSAGGGVRLVLPQGVGSDLSGSLTGMLVYRLVISSEARANWGRIGVFSSFFY